MFELQSSTHSGCNALIGRVWIGPTEITHQAKEPGPATGSGIVADKTRALPHLPTTLKNNSAAASFEAKSQQQVLYITSISRQWSPPAFFPVFFCYSPSTILPQQIFGEHVWSGRPGQQLCSRAIGRGGGQKAVHAAAGTDRQGTGRGEAGA